MQIYEFRRDDPLWVSIRARGAGLDGLVLFANTSLSAVAGRGKGNDCE